MEKAVSKNKKLMSLIPQPKRFTSVVLVLIIVSGVMSAMFAAITGDLRGREFLRSRAQTIANALPVDYIEQLEGDPSDSNKFAYSQLKRRLELIKSDNHDLRFIYLLGLNDNRPVYMVDAAPSNSQDFSPPGSIYDRASERLKGSFDSSEAFVEGPARYQWNSWISAFAPVIDPATGQAIALVGIDTPAANYYFPILIYALVPLSLAAIPLAGLLRDRKLQLKEWEITQLKNQFVSIASHELRSPLSGMLWAIQSLLKNPAKNLNEKQKALLEDMFKSAESSTATINEILDLSVFERDPMLFKTSETIDVIPVLREVQRTLSLGAQERDMRIVLDDSIPLAATTKGDINALRRALMNIVSNSIKYSYGNSDITIGYKGKDEQHVFFVRDRGIGIPKEEQEKVINGYYRAKNAAKVQAHGTGLGLWITRLIIEQHNGKLWMESEEKKGTTMFIGLPKFAAFTDQEPPKSALPRHQA